MFSTSDTIVAIATPPGRGGIGVVRLSGPDALSVAHRLIARDKPLVPRYATLTEIQPTDGDAIDQAVVTYFPAPASYTGEDVLEISAHGSPVVLRGIVELAMEHGARLAEPGEFTLRAYLHGRIDLMQAEAIGDLIEAVTPLQARTAFDQLQGTLTQAIGEMDAALLDLVARLEASVDFPEEGYHFGDRYALAEAMDAVVHRAAALLSDGKRGRLVREGLEVAVVGATNVGKSSLFNRLAGAARAIVTDVPGTTRDLITETVDLGGLKVSLVDTAGVRAPGDDVVESEGIIRAKRAAKVADLILLVRDRSQPVCREDEQWIDSDAAKKTVVVANKADLPAAWVSPDAVEVSALTGEGFDGLRQRILERLGVDDALMDRPEITNVRHLALVGRAHDALCRARVALLDGDGLPEEFVLADLQDARSALEEITGRRTADDVLAHIFDRFCIGK